MRTTHQHLASQMTSLRPVLSGLLVASVLGLMTGGAFAQSAVSGQTQYTTLASASSTFNCATCHGADPAANTAKIWNGVSAQVIKNAVLGNTGGMNIFASLTDTQYNNLAAYIAQRRGVAGTYIAIPVPIFTLDPSPLVLGNVQSGTTGGAQTVTLTKSGGPALTVSSVTASAGFMVSTDTCSAGISTPTGSCTIGITASPAVGTAAGPANGNLTITSNASTSTGTLALNANVTTAPVVPLSWTGTPSGAFATSVLVGASSTTPLSLTLNNTGTQSVTGVIPSVSSSGDFTLAGTCAAAGGATIAANSSCILTVTFQPSSAGAKTATLSVVSTNGSMPAPITLSGTATSPITAGNNAGGGGCTLGGVDRPMDPLWLLMLGSAAFVLRRRLPLAKAAR